MSFNISAASLATNSIGSNSPSTSKPVWNPNKVYKYIEDMGQGFQAYRKEASAYYSSMISREEGDGTLSVDELKSQMKELFPDYTLTDSEPRNVVQGKFYLYIDNHNLEKMAQDPTYRAKIYGLMDSEIQGKKGYTLQYSDGRNVTAHLTGSIFSLSEKNEKYDGIPYSGSSMSDQPFSSSSSHPQMRGQSFLNDTRNPKKSSAVKHTTEALIEKRREKRKTEKKQLQKKQDDKRLEKQTEKRKADKEHLQEIMEQMSAASKYKTIDFEKK